MATISLKNDTYFWVLLPLFIAISGNLAPFRLGPILPIYFLFGVFAGLNVGYINDFARRNKWFVFFSFAFFLYFVGFTLAAIPGYGLNGGEFFGATAPRLYATLSFVRYILSICVLIVLANKPQPNSGLVYGSLQIAYLMLFAPLLLQAVVYTLFGFEFGFIFHTATGTRFGGLVGEPQTASAWLFCLFYILYSFHGTTGFPRSHLAWLLLGSQMAVLALTGSTAWIIAFVLLLFLRLGNVGRLIAGAVAGSAVTMSSLTLVEKVSTELFAISERSITVVAGFEVYIASLRTILFGYGLGLSPYLLGAASIFQLYPDLNLSDLGRQDVMNSYLEIIFELGVFGAPLFFYLFAKASRIYSSAVFLQTVPILVGIFGVGGGFFAGYLLLSVPLVARMRSQPEKPGLNRTKIYRITALPLFASLRPSR